MANEAGSVEYGAAHVKTPVVVILGEAEMAEHSLTIKVLATGEQIKVAVPAAADVIRQRLQ